MNKQQKTIVYGFIRTVAICGAGGLIMVATGDWEQRSWLIWISMAVLPWYFVYQAVWKEGPERPE